MATFSFPPATQDPVAEIEAVEFEPGDFIPYFFVDNEERYLDIQSKASVFRFLVFANANATDEDLSALLAAKPAHQIHVVTASATGLNNALLFTDPNVVELMGSRKATFAVYFCDKNLKIIDVAHTNDPIAALNAQSKIDLKPYERTLPPILVVPRVISEDFADRLMAYLDENEDRSSENRSTFKSRNHIQASKELEAELDKKLRKSLLPEVRKVFHCDVAYRENYKICSYQAEAGGKFGMHRDTVPPTLHRRYALTIVLNDDFEGGGITFPEYVDAIIRAPKCSAVVFSGSLFHQVKPIAAGKRYVIVSFMFSEDEEEANEERRTKYGYTVDPKINFGDITMQTILPLRKSGGERGVDLGARSKRLAEKKASTKQ